MNSTFWNEKAMVHDPSIRLYEASLVQRRELISARRLSKYEFE